MTDHFSLLGEPRRPWLDPAALKPRFISLSSEVHPDRIHGASEADKRAATQRFAALNAAYNCLRDPRDRLLHLLDLELGERPKDVQRIPAGTMDLFVEVGQLCGDADAFLTERRKVTSPLLRVGLFEKGLAWADNLNHLQKKIDARREGLLAEMRSMDRAWESAPPVGAPDRARSLPLERLEQIYRILSYTTRWTEQIQERLVQVMSSGL